MEKTEMMKRYESETGKQSAIVRFMAGGQALESKDFPKIGPYDYSTDYIAWLEAKAAAYDRIMSGGKKTLKEWANIFGKPVVVDYNWVGIVFDESPELLRPVEFWIGPHGYIGIIPSMLIDYTGSWQDSLTLPDRWEEK